MTQNGKNAFITLMRISLFTLCLSMLIHGCGEKIDQSSVETSRKTSNGQDSVISRAEGIAMKLLDTYSSIEKSFAQAEADLQETDRSAEEILSELQKAISDLGTTAKSMERELSEIKASLNKLDQELEKLALEGPSSEKSIYTESRADIESTRTKKVQPMDEFDFPFVQKVVSELEENMARWKKTFDNLSSFGKDGARKKLAEMLTNHFDNIAQVIRDRKASLSSSQ